MNDALMEDADSDNSLPFGHGASAFGSEDGDEEEDVIPRRRSLDLGPWEPALERSEVERAASPAPSYLSMQSDDLSFHIEESGLNEEAQPLTTTIQLDRQDSSGSSCYSFSSNEGMEDCNKAEKKSKKRPYSQPSAPAPPVKPELVKDPNEKRHPAMTVEFTFKALQICLKKLSAADLKKFKRILWERYPECFQDPLESWDIVDVVDKMLEVCDIEVSLQITLLVLKDMNLKKVAEHLEGLCKRNKIRYELKATLKRKYEHFYEGLVPQRQPTPFGSVYTDLYLTEGAHAASNSEHEFRHIEDLQEGKYSKRDMISSKDIFSPEVVEARHLRTVVSKGSSGMGKSTAVQKFIMDWVEGVAHQDVFFLLPLPFKELNQMSEDQISLTDLICRFYPEMKELDTLEFDDCIVMFICDGLDECAVPLDFRRTPYWCDPCQPNSLKFLITNLIRGNLLLSAYVWVTTRPIAMNLLPPESIHQLLEVRGYNYEQRETYFRKAIADKELAERAVAHVKSCKTLHILCHMPLFCRVVCNELERDLRSLTAGKELPKAITHFYIRLMLMLVSTRQEKLQNCPLEGPNTPSDQEFVTKLAKLAFQLLEKNTFSIETEHWKESGLQVKDAVDITGLCTQFYRERFVMYYEKVDCFIHPTVQEFLAALHVFMVFKNQGKNVLEGNKFKMFKEHSLTNLLKSAVDKALHDKSRNYDIFLRFLLGLSVDANQDLLRGFISNTGPSKTAREETANYIRKKVRDNPEKSENLQLCSDELFPMP